MNIATVIVFLGIAGAVIGAIVSIRKRKATGSCCSGGCEHCAMNGLCRK